MFIKALLENECIEGKGSVVERRLRVNRLFPVKEMILIPVTLGVDSPLFYLTCPDVPCERPV